MRRTMALVLLIIAAACSPSKSQKYSDLFRRCDNDGDFRAAIQACNMALAAPSITARGAAMFLNMRGNANYTAHRYREAMLDYRKAIHRYAKFDYPYANRAMLEMKLGDLKSALRDYGTAVNLGPRNLWARYGRGIARRRAGDTRAGDADIAVVNKEDPEIAKGYAAQGFKP